VVLLIYTWRIPPQHVFTGMVGVCTAPFIGRLIDGLIPWMATLIATLMILVSQAVQIGGGTISIGAVVVATFSMCACCIFGV
jgi:hypothetical protein